MVINEAWHRGHEVDARARCGVQAQVILMDHLSGCRPVEELIDTIVGDDINVFAVAQFLRYLLQIEED